ncbi:MAG TPA: hypothetical protein VF698_02810 [Thermoanaerobaculia bacterium]|jgi:hypothetical protein
MLLMTASSVRDRVSPLADKIQAVVPKPFDVIDIASLVHSCVEIRRELDAPKQAPAPTRHDERLRKLGGTRRLLRNLQRRSAHSGRCQGKRLIQNCGPRCVSTIIRMKTIARKQ